MPRKKHHFSKFILFAFFMLSSIFGKAQITPRFSVFIGNNYDNKINCVIADTATNDYYIAGKSTNDRAFFGQLDSSGSLIFVKEFNTNLDPIEGMVRAVNGDFLLLTHVNDDFVIIRIDQSGSIIWSKKYHHKIEWGGKIVRSNNTNFIIAGNYTSATTENDLLVFKINNTGDIVWTMLIDDEDDVVTDLVSDDNGGCIVAGNIGGSSKPNKSLFLINIDKNGNATSFQEYDASDKEEKNPKITKDINGGYAVTGAIDSASFQIFLLKVDASLGEEWSIILRNSHDEVPISITQNTNGGLYFISSTYQSGTSKRAVISVVDTTSKYNHSSRLDYLSETHIRPLSDSDMLIWSNSKTFTTGFGLNDGFVGVLGPSFSACYVNIEPRTKDTLIWTPAKWAPIISGINLSATAINIAPSNITFKDTNACCPVVASFISTNKACVGDTLVFVNDSKKAKYYKWYVNNNLITTQDDLSYTFAKSGYYNIRLETGDSNCVDLHTTTVKIDSLPEIVFQKDTILCPDDLLTVVPLCTGCTYMWENGDGTGTRVFDSPGTYTLTVTNDCGSITDSFNLAFLDYPTIELTESQEFSCDYTKMTLNVNCDNCSDYVWVIGDEITTSQTEVNTFVSIKQEQVIVKLAYYHNNCLDTLTEVITLNADGFKPDEIPNIFTPNGDGINDCLDFKIDPAYADCYGINIYNRWGKVVFSSSDISECWDGTLDNKPLAQGVYFYVMDFAGESLKGSIHLQ